MARIRLLAIQRRGVNGGVTDKSHRNASATSVPPRFKVSLIGRLSADSFMWDWYSLPRHSYPSLRQDEKKQTRMLTFKYGHDVGD